MWVFEIQKALEALRQVINVDFILLEKIYPVGNLIVFKTTTNSIYTYDITNKKILRRK